MSLEDLKDKAAKEIEEAAEGYWKKYSLPTIVGGAGFVLGFLLAWIF